LRAKIAELIAPRIPLEDLRYEVTTYLTTCIIHLQGILDIDDALLFTQTPTELGRAFVIYFPKDYEMDIRSLIRSLPLPPSEYAMFHPFSEIHDSDRELDHESLYLQLTFPLPR
jgi:hypothetical protein